MIRLGRRGLVRWGLRDCWGERRDSGKGYGQLPPEMRGILSTLMPSRPVRLRILRMAVTRVAAVGFWCTGATHKEPRIHAHHEHQLVPADVGGRGA